jgi:cell wall-associated NlpC family hydrolase
MKTAKNIWKLSLYLKWPDFSGGQHAPFSLRDLVKPLLMTIPPIRALFLLLLISLVAGCQSSPPRTSPGGAVSSIPADTGQRATLQQLYEQHQQWRGTPYRLGGQSRAGIDCSAFVQTTFMDQFGIALPRTTSQQLYAGEQISKADLQAGDLVFFRNGQHVGIYLEEDKFLHASTRLGVTISSMNNVYWSRKYWRSIRVQSRLIAR